MAKKKKQMAQKNRCTYVCIFSCYVSCWLLWLKNQKTLQNSPKFDM